MRAAVLRGPRNLQVDDVEIDVLRPGDVRVRLLAAGVCHSDLSVYQSGGVGMLSPVVLGHEGAGIVEEISATVDGLEVGDHVVLSTTPQCGRCGFCLNGQPTLCDDGLPVKVGNQVDGTTRLLLDGAPVGQMSGLGTWAEEAVVSAAAAIKIDPRVPFPQAALIGCAVVTGFGAAAKVGEVEKGETVAVIGCGGVGLNGVQGARIRGAQRIIAIDVTQKLGRATTMGATHVVDVNDVDDVVAAVREITGGLGVDKALDFVGSAATIRQSLAVLRRGGTCVVTGLGSSEWSLSPRDFVLSGKSLRANYMGMGRFSDAFNDLVSLYLSGDLLLDKMVSRIVRLTGIGQAFAAMEGGEVARSVIDLT